MRPSYGSILIPLFEDDGLRIGEVARRARLSKQTLTTMVRLLETDHLNDQLALFPTRVVELPEGRSAYSFTMFKAPEMPDELFESQHRSLLHEFDNIRQRFAAGVEGR